MENQMEASRILRDSDSVKFSRKLERKSSGTYLKGGLKN